MLIKILIDLVILLIYWLCTVPTFFAYWKLERFNLSQQQTNRFILAATAAFLGYAFMYMLTTWIYVREKEKRLKAKVLRQEELQKSKEDVGEVGGVVEGANHQIQAQKENQNFNNNELIELENLLQQFIYPKISPALISRIKQLTIESVENGNAQSAATMYPKLNEL